MNCKCDNCGYTCDSSELNEARDLDQRLDYPIGHPDCIEPEGECPKCGALAYADGTTESIEPVSEGANSTCSDCGVPVESVVGCPDGAEVCPDCFDSGAH